MSLQKDAYNILRHHIAS